VIPLASRYERWAEIWSNGCIIIPINVEGTNYLDIKPELFDPDAGAFGTPWLPRGKQAQLRIMPLIPADSISIIQSGQGRNETISLTDELRFSWPQEPGVYVYEVRLEGRVSHSPTFVFKVRIL
jgi:hypothetical protein